MGLVTLSEPQRVAASNFSPYLFKHIRYEVIPCTMQPSPGIVSNKKKKSWYQMKNRFPNTCDALLYLHDRLPNEFRALILFCLVPNYGHYLYVSWKNPTMKTHIREYQQSLQSNHWLIHSKYLVVFEPKFVNKHRASYSQVADWLIRSNHWA